VTSTVPREVARARPHDPPTDRRLAGIHLKLGLLGLARAELEALAGSGGLDDRALLFLAEARWRTGDLAGAGEAAQAYLTAGGDDILALVIAAEATSAVGRPGEARRLAGLALSRAEVPLDRLFAGMRRSSIWPADPAAAPSDETILMPAAGTPAPATPDLRAGEPSGTAAGAVVVAPREAGTPLEEAPSAEAPAEAAAEPVAEAAPPARPHGFWDFESIREGGGPNPRAELDVARSELGTDRASATIRLAVVLRLEPDLAADVLDLVQHVEWPSAELDLIRGDALRLLGREDDARRAYDSASAALRGAPHDEPAKPIGGIGPAQAQEET
jgi:hypothetical protein